MVDAKYFVYICDKKEFFDISKKIGSPMDIYDYCYNKLSIYPALLKEKVVKRYGDIL